MKRNNIALRNAAMYCLMSAFVLTAGGCGKEEARPSAGRMVEMTLKPAIRNTYENIPATYAPGDEGGVQNVDGDLYELRYILEAWTQENEPRLAGRWIDTAEIGASAPEFTPRLLQGEYTFVVWADFILKDTAPEDGDLFYTTASLRNIVLRGDYTINDHAKDAYTGRQSVVLHDSGTSIDIQLRRPLAMIRLVAENIPAPGITEGYTLSLSYEGGLYDGFDALTGNAFISPSGTGSLESLQAPPDDNYGNPLAFDYLLVNDEGLDAAVTMVVQYEEQTPVENRKINGVPVRRNTITTITGNLLTVQ